jgi:hypothetical protein
MRIDISTTEFFIVYGARSGDKFHRALSDHILDHFDINDINGDNDEAVLLECFNWCTDQFRHIVVGLSDWLFLLRLFTYHESSILLWKRQLGGENIQETIGIYEEELALNRRIFKLALEQTCDANYTFHSVASLEKLGEIDRIIEDLLFLGSEIYFFANILAERKMLTYKSELYLDLENLLQWRRPKDVESIFDAVVPQMGADFAKGIFDDEAVEDMKLSLQNCMQVNYDFAGHQVVVIKQHHNLEEWDVQTIEPGILVVNQVAMGTPQAEAQRFFDGLTLSRHNKLPIREAVYKVNSTERYSFRPILVVQQNGQDRQLIGVNKWAESITMLATNGFQWQVASSEWKDNECFRNFLASKSNDHDKLLEDQVVLVLNDLGLHFDRNVVSFSSGGVSKRVDNVAGVGEMDLVWADPTRNTLVVADCKYNRARYDMLSFRSDYSTFVNSYEKKLNGKITWVKANLSLVCDHLMAKFPDLKIDPANLDVVGLFIINTPTFYMLNAPFVTVCFFQLEALIQNGYWPPAIAIEERVGTRTQIRLKKYPYLTS